VTRKLKWWHLERYTFQLWKMIRDQKYENRHAYECSHCTLLSAHLRMSPRIRLNITLPDDFTTLLLNLSSWTTSKPAEGSCWNCMERGTKSALHPYMSLRDSVAGMAARPSYAGRVPLENNGGRWVMDIGRSGNGVGNRNLPGSSDPHVQEVVKAAHEELRQLMRQRADVMKRIGTVKQTIVGLANLFGDEVLSEELLELVDRKSGGRQPGFTKACRMVLMEAARPLGAREVCEHIQQRIPPVLLRHKDPLASVTTVLNRLVEYGEARTVLRENGRRAWEWVADPAESGFASARGSIPVSNL
jgi:hypothetical protein